MDIKKDIVKEIFERPKQAAEKVSAIFTYFRDPAKSVLSKQHKEPSSSGRLPAGIDIGTQAVKIFQLAQTSKPTGEIATFDREDLPKSQQEQLKAIIARNDIGPEVVAALPLKDLRIYNFTFPLMSEEELKQAVYWKIAQSRPFGLGPEELVFDYIKIDAASGFKTTQTMVLAVCAAKTSVEKIISLFADLNLKLQEISAAPISLINLSQFRKLPPAENEVTLWLDLGAQESSLAIEKGSSLYFCRGLSFNALHLTTQISKVCGVSEPEAEKLKKQYGFSFWSADKKIPVFKEDESRREKQDLSLSVYHSIVSALENLVVDIQHSFKYFSYQVVQSQITKFDRVILCGGGSNLKNLEAFLSARLGVPVEKINPFSFFKLPANLPQEKKLLLDAGVEFAEASGLAVASKISAAKRINLLPKERAKQGLEFLKEHLQQTPVKIAALAVSLAVFLIIVQAGRLGFYSFKNKSFAAKIRTAQSQLSRLQSQQLNLAEDEGKFLEQKNLLESRLNVLNSAVRSPENFSQVLAEVAGILPQDIWATKLLYAERKISLTGSAQDVNLITQLIEELKKSADFKEVTFNYTQKDPKTNSYNFEIGVELKP